MKQNKYKTNYEHTLATIFQFSMVFMDVYENPPKRSNAIDETIKDFLTKLNQSVEKDE